MAVNHQKIYGGVYRAKQEVLVGLIYIEILCFLFTMEKYQLLLLFLEATKQHIQIFSKHMDENMKSVGRG